jgi:hypothetical protein
MIMENQCEQFEREAEETRWQLSATLEELRGRMTPGRVVDQLVDYARQGPASEFLRNLGREVRENPVPLVLIGISIAWLALASSRTSRTAIASAADSATRKATEVGSAASAAVTRTGEWSRLTAERLSESANNAATAVSGKTVDLATRAREATGAVAARVGRTSNIAFAGSGERDTRAAEGALEALHREKESASAVEAAALQYR